MNPTTIDPHDPVRLETQRRVDATAEQHIRVEALHCAVRSQPVDGWDSIDDVLDVADAMADWLRTGSRPMAHRLCICPNPNPQCPTHGIRP